MQSKPSILVIFDIDGTLISGGSYAKEHFLGAFADVTGKHLDPDGYQFAGMTDRGIVRKMAEMASLDSNFNELFETFENRFYHRMLNGYSPSVGAGVLPGVKSLLDYLKTNFDTLTTLGTGNCKRTAFVKLSYFGIADYFQGGGFGGDFEIRTDVIRRAMNLAAKNNHWSGEAWVIGDTVRDIVAGHEAGAKVLAVGTGPKQDYKKMGEMADVFVNDLSDLKYIKESLGII